MPSRPYTLLEKYKASVSMIISVKGESTEYHGSNQGRGQNTQKRPLNGAWQGKQVFNNNREGSLERTYAKAQKHREIFVWNII